MADWFSGIKPHELVARLRARRSNTTVQDIEDAVQDVMLNVHRKLRSDAPPPQPEHPTAYLVRATENRLNSIYRSRRREAPEVNDEQIERHLNENNVTSINRPDQVYEARERAQLFGALVELIRRQADDAGDQRENEAFAGLQARLREELSDRHWILLKMRALNQIGFQQCSDTMGISLGSVYNWNKRALDIVRDCLLELGIEPGALDYDG